MKIIDTHFGQMDSGEKVKCYRCENDNGFSVVLMPYGATLVQMSVPDKFGNIGPVVLGFSDLNGYLGPHPSFGSTVGRYCNRIAGAAFTLNGINHCLSKNEGAHHLHGGTCGLGRQLWKAEPFIQSSVGEVSEVGVIFSIRSPAGDMGYPGNLDAQVTYVLRNDNTLRIRFRAQTDAPTHVNFTNHAYWNLALDQDETVENHRLKISATHILEVDQSTVPTGNYLPVAETDFDFTRLQSLREKLKIRNGKGFDHCFANPLDNCNFPEAVLKSITTGRCLGVSSTQPGLQLYTSQFLSGEAYDGGFKAFSGVCLEPQHFPDTPHHAHFPGTLLNPGETYAEEISLRFWVEPD